MAKTGMPGDPPLIAGTFVADSSGALSLAGGVLAALFARERTGEGQRVDSSIYGTVIAIQSTEINYTSFTGVEPERTGRGADPLLHGVWGHSKPAMVIFAWQASMTNAGPPSAVFLGSNISKWTPVTTL